MLTTMLTPFPILTTQRLSLRQLAISDVEEIFALRSDSEINRYLARQLSTTIEEARNFVNKVNENVEKNASLYWAITFNNNNNNKLVGTICLFDFSDANHKCEIGYELLTNFQKQGIMKEAVQRVIEYAFNTIKVNKIEAFLHKDNQSSIKLLDKFSFKISNESDRTNHDIICYLLINPLQS